VKDVFGSVVFYRSFPMPQGMKGYPLQSWVLKFLCDAFSLLAVVISVMVKRLFCIISSKQWYKLNIYNDDITSFRQGRNTWKPSLKLKV
jgi:hypothetical protein